MDDDEPVIEDERLELIFTCCHPGRGRTRAVRGQDRSLWDVERLAARRRALERAIALRGRGANVLQATIALPQTEEDIAGPRAR